MCSIWRYITYLHFNLCQCRVLSNGVCPFAVKYNSYRCDHMFACQVQFSIYSTNILKFFNDYKQQTHLNWIDWVYNTCIERIYNITESIYSNTSIVLHLHMLGQSEITITHDTEGIRYPLILLYAILQHNFFSLYGITKIRSLMFYACNK